MQPQHHAYVYYGADISAVSAALQQTSADVQHILVDQFTIADSRALLAAAQSKPVTASRKSLVVQFERATNEAQNALLKLLEEPPATTELHLLVPAPASLLETVRSRLQVMTQQDRSQSGVWSDFAALPLAEQLAEIASRSKAKDVAWQSAVLQAAIVDERIAPATRLVLDTYAQAPGASRKMLLEELVLSLARPQ